MEYERSHYCVVKIRFYKTFVTNLRFKRNRTVKQKEIIAKFRVQSLIDPKGEFRASVNFLKNYLRKYNSLRTLILGISGGQDSTLTGVICQKTILELRQETGIADYRFIAVRLPYGTQKDEKDCLDAIAFIKPDCIVTVDIKSAVQASESALREAGILLNDHVKNNDKARERMKIQYNIAGMTAGLVVGTDHAAESITGFFTKYGDGGTDINPLFRLNKRQCRAILEYLDCPKHLYLKAPIAGLEEGSDELFDETVLGVTYEVLDDYLEGKNIDDNSARVIEDWHQRTKHKRHLPVTIFDDFWK